MLTPDINKRKARVAWLSVGSNTLLVVAKLVVGVLIGSVSVISEAIHSGMDLVAAGIALFAVKTSARPADEDHPWGHAKVENISGAVEALLIFVAAGWIVYEAVQRLTHPSELEGPGWGAAVMLVSAAVNIVVSQMLFKVARDTESVALEADAWHLRTDVWTSLGVMVSLAAIWFGHMFFPQVDLHWLDPASAIVVALLICIAAWELTVKSTKDLLDRSLPPEEEQWIREYLAGLRPSVHGFHRLRTRRSGRTRFVDVHMLVDEDLHVRVAHDIAEQATEAIDEHFPGASVTTHVEPCAGECGDDCLSGCLLREEERVAVRELHEQHYDK